MLTPMGQRTKPILSGRIWVRNFAVAPKNRGGAGQAWGSPSTAVGFATTTCVPHAIRGALGSVSIDALSGALAIVRQVVEQDWPGFVDFNLEGLPVPRSHGAAIALPRPAEAARSRARIGGKSTDTNASKR